jgi:hypothetical protein
VLHQCTVSRVLDVKPAAAGLGQHARHGPTTRQGAREGPAAGFGGEGAVAALIGSHLLRSLQCVCVCVSLFYGCLVAGSTG